MKTGNLAADDDFTLNGARRRSSNRRQTRLGLNDHDVSAGLPIRQWRRDLVTVTPSTSHEITAGQNDIWAVELLHGMPKESHLLPQHSQDLLRAARSGKIYKAPITVEEEDPDPDAISGDKAEKRDESLLNRGFVARAWRQIPRHMEGPEIEYLAERRKGLITANDYPIVSNGPLLTKTTVKRVDAAGNEYIQDVVVPQGQKIEGEVISQAIIPDQSSVTDVYTSQPTPPKRRGNVRKKFKPLGRPRKKKPAPRGSTSESTVPFSHAVDDTVDTVTTWDSNSTPANNEDTEMGEESLLNSDEGEGYDGEDVEEIEEDERIANIQKSPSKRTEMEPGFHISLPNTNQKSFHQVQDTLSHMVSNQTQDAASDQFKLESQPAISNLSQSTYSSRIDLLNENSHVMDQTRVESSDVVEKNLAYNKSEAIPLGLSDSVLACNRPLGTDIQDEQMLDFNGRPNFNTDTKASIQPISNERDENPIESSSYTKLPSQNISDQSGVVPPSNQQKLFSNLKEGEIDFNRTVTESSHAGDNEFPILLD
ncbi:hypothetical protein K3495_g4028 [Podosphaera aphanis]|nr:hypothetical protein K3495_g4028 [Podosphaera aphanis]